MKTVWENRCLICDTEWKSESCTELCPKCGEEYCIYSEEELI